MTPDNQFFFVMNIMRVLQVLLLWEDDWMRYARSLLCSRNKSLPKGTSNWQYNEIQKPLRNKKEDHMKNCLQTPHYMFLDNQRQHKDVGTWMYLQSIKSV